MSATLDGATQGVPFLEASKNDESVMRTASGWFQQIYATNPDSIPPGVKAMGVENFIQTVARYHRARSPEALRDALVRVGATPLVAHRLVEATTFDPLMTDPITAGAGPDTVMQSPAEYEPIIAPSDDNAVPGTDDPSGQIIDILAAMPPSEARDQAYAAIEPILASGGDVLGQIASLAETEADPQVQQIYGAILTGLDSSPNDTTPMEDPTEGMGDRIVDSMQGREAEYSEYTGHLSDDYGNDIPPRKTPGGKYLSQKYNMDPDLNPFGSITPADRDEYDRANRKHARRSQRRNKNTEADESARLLRSMGVELDGLDTGDGSMEDLQSEIEMFERQAAHMPEGPERTTLEKHIGGLMDRYAQMEEDLYGSKEEFDSWGRAPTGRGAGEAAPVKKKPRESFWSDDEINNAKKRWLSMSAQDRDDIMRQYDDTDTVQAQGGLRGSQLDPDKPHMQGFLASRYSRESHKETLTEEYIRNLTPESKANEEANVIRTLYDYAQKGMSKEEMKLAFQNREFMSPYEHQFGLEKIGSLKDKKKETENYGCDCPSTLAKSLGIQHIAEAAPFEAPDTEEEYSGKHMIPYLHTGARAYRTVTEPSEMSKLSASMGKADQWNIDDDREEARLWYNLARGNIQRAPFVKPKKDIFHEDDPYPSYVGGIRALQARDRNESKHERYIGKRKGESPLDFNATEADDIYWNIGKSFLHDNDKKILDENKWKKKPLKRGIGEPSREYSGLYGQPATAADYDLKIRERRNRARMYPEEADQIREEIARLESRKANLPAGEATNTGDLRKKIPRPKKKSKEADPNDEFELFDTLNRLDQAYKSGNTKMADMLEQNLKQISDRISGSEASALPGKLDTYGAPQDDPGPDWEPGGCLGCGDRDTPDDDFCDSCNRAIDEGAMRALGK